MPLEMTHPGREFRVPYPARGTPYSTAEVEAVRAVLERDATLSCGEERTAFEHEFAAFLGVDPRLAVATSSCTVALELATYLAHLRRGDNVIVTPQSYQATLNPLLALEVEVRFGDVDPESLSLDPASVERLLDGRTRAVFLTHYGGLMADMEGLRDVLAGRDVTVVEDCAHAHGSAIGGRRAGAWGNVACYSFQSMKNISTLGQGGMMILPDVETAERVRRLIAVEPDARFAPRTPAGELGPYRAAPPSVFTHDKNAFTHDCTGIRRHGTNSTLPEPAAAVGRVQLRRLGEFLEGRARVARRLDAHLEALPGVRPQRTPAGYAHAHHLYTCRVDPRIGNGAVAAAMVERGVEIQQRYFPLHLLPEWRARGGRVGLCPVAERIWFGEQLNLPIYPHMSDDQVDCVADALRHALAAA
jgi:perosamine synthetase